MIDTQVYLVTREVAQRTGQLQYKYRTRDGRFIVDSRTLSMVRMTTEEYIHGIQGIEPITVEEMEALKAENGYVMGDAPSPVVPKVSEEVSEEVEEPTEEETETETEVEEIDNNEAVEEEELKTTKKGKK